MIVLERVMPSKLRLLEVVLRRLAESDIDYPKYQEMFFKIRKGYIGETRSGRIEMKRAYRTQNRAYPPQNRS